jgi:hypothetical protein
MLFSLKELSLWLGISPFEMWMHLLCTTVFSILVPLKVEGLLSESTTWWQVFSPMFISDALSGYFTIIVFVRLYMSRHIALAVRRSLWSVVMLLLFFVFKLLVCLRLEEITEYPYTAAMAPLFTALGFLTVRSCYVNGD